MKMAYASPSVYRENCFSVDFEENPMFMRVKQGSLLGRNVPEALPGQLIGQSEIDIPEPLIALLTCTDVEVAGSLDLLALAVGTLRPDGCGCHRWALGGLAVLSAEVIGHKALFPAVGLEVLGWHKPIIVST